MSTETPATENSVEELEARLAAARAASQAEQERAAAERDARELAYRRRRLAGYDLRAYSAAVRDAERVAREALAAEDSATGAVVRLHLARWDQHRARQIAYSDAQAIAAAEGHQPPQDPGLSTPDEQVVQTLHRVLDQVAADAVAEAAEAADAAFAEAVFGTTDREAVLAVEAEAEAVRRRRSARVTTSAVDVTGMSEAERAKVGAQPGRTRRDLTANLTLGG